MEKMTIGQFTTILNGFNNGDKVSCRLAVSMIAEGTLSSDRLSEIPMYLKASLGRKVLRYIAKVALSGTFEIDGLAASMAFCEMQGGYPVSFASNTEWSFNYEGSLINVNIDRNEVYYYDKRFIEIWHCEIPQGCRWTEPVGKAILVRMFEDHH